MSRNDMYLSLCLEQALLSPLHYRHGCIVVRGGKVIGKGYNDYRPGFDGGYFTTGQLRSAAASTSPNISHLKLKKKKNTSDPTKISMSVKKPAATYIALQGHGHDLSSGGGALASTPFSMHSEMMAIYSALSLSSAIANRGSARSAHACGTSKPTPMPSAMPPRENSSSGLRRPALASLMFKGLVLKPLHLNAVQHYGENLYPAKEEEVKEEQQQQHVEDLAVRQLANKGNEKHHKYAYSVPHYSQDHHQRHHKREQRTQQQQRAQHRQGTTVVPQKRIHSKSHQLVERIKDPRLNGADLYVARLGRGEGKPGRLTCHHNSDSTANKNEPNGSNCQTPTPSSCPSARPSTGSLHDELRFPSPTAAAVDKPKSKPPPADRDQERLTATSSRPCYRCISYMHLAGIKRVFWTNSHGEWEGGKVRDLADALEGPMLSSSGGSDGMNAVAPPVYVTKSEVLLMKGLR
ncbi:MAG: hypothetical protein Q9220_007539 [cf. Caloplaca sp. 1 TL-2023]